MTRPHGIEDDGDSLQSDRATTSISSPTLPKISLCISQSHLTRDQRTARSKSTRRLIVAVQAKRSPGIGGRLAQGSGERQRRGTKSRHCPEPVRSKALENRPAGKRK